jgi:hypothetical protein
MSSDGGVVDEDDDEPFSASSQVEVSAAAKPDVAARRPQPGGRFPSDLQVNAQRGLQAPISPSSVSSGKLSGHDYEAAMASGGLQDSGDYGSTVRNEPLGYGSTARTPLEAPSHATIVTREAMEDGVNPYTSEPLRPASTTNAHYGNPVTNIRSSVSTRGRQSVPESRKSGEMVMMVDDVPGKPYTKQESETKFTPMHGKRPAVDGAYDGEFPSANGMVASHNRKLSNPVDVKVYPSDDDVKPTTGTVRNASVPTLANFHIPGQYPKTPMNGTQNQAVGGYGGDTDTRS